VSVERLAPAVVERLIAEHGRDLHAFLWGVLRNHDLAAEAFQATCRKVLEVGHTARADTLRGWLFRVGLNEALGIKRRAGTEQRVLARYGEQQGAPVESEAESPALRMITAEDITRLKAELSALPQEQRYVVERRIYHEETFAEIATSLRVPLGTVLTRMRLALRKLQRAMGAAD
jgi:RNA polymerase sigma-70 factor (ECF subfamily)